VTETTLTPANVTAAQFGKIFSYIVDVTSTRNRCTCRRHLSRRRT